MSNVRVVAMLSLACFGLTESGGAMGGCEIGLNHGCCQFVDPGFVIPCLGAPGNICRAKVVDDDPVRILVTDQPIGYEPGSYQTAVDTFCEYFAPSCAPLDPHGPCLWAMETTIFRCDFNVELGLSAWPCP